jgi:alkylhydroperoxidase/carboxymuconolactone decarboxylase family protein YurZ
LEGLWQDPAPLARTCQEIAHALRHHPRLRALTADFPTLPERLEELAAIAQWAAQQRAKIRLTYLL